MSALFIVPDASAPLDLTWEWKLLTKSVQTVTATATSTGTSSSSCTDLLETSSTPLDQFYHSIPHFIHSIDDAAREALLSAYIEAFRNAEQVAVEMGGRDAMVSALDLCASWSHNWPSSTILARSVGIGLCNGELERAGFDEYFELNICGTTTTTTTTNTTSSSLPLETGAFHIITCACGIPYLTNPVHAFTEAARILCVKGGVVLVSFSDHIVTPERATKKWLQWSESERVLAIFEWATLAGFKTVHVADASPLKGTTHSLILVKLTKG